MIAIRGMGWIDAVEFGRVGAGDRIRYHDRASLGNLWRHFTIFEYPVKNFGRFDATSKLTCYAAALALRDAGIQYRAGQGLDMGIVLTSHHGCLKANEDYFRDYVDSGRTLARGGLFIYTLPTSPAAEAAIHLGLQGPTVYLTDRQNSLARVMKVAAGFVDRREVSSMMVVRTENDKALGIVMAQASSEPVICDLERAFEIVDRCEGIAALVTGFDEG